MMTTGSSGERGRIFFTAEYEVTPEHARVAAQLGSNPSMSIK
jgi:hypothetical protein